MIENNQRLASHLKGEVGNIFKVLPLFEEGNVGVFTYIDSLLKSLFELDSVIKMEYSNDYINILTAIKSAKSEMEQEQSKHKIVRREILKSIDILKKLIEKIEESD